MAFSLNIFQLANYKFFKPIWSPKDFSQTEQVPFAQHFPTGQVFHTLANLVALK